MYGAPRLYEAWVSTSPVQATWKFCGAMGRGFLPGPGGTMSARVGSEVTLAGGGGDAWKTCCRTIHEDASGMAELTAVARDLSCGGLRGVSDAR